jgi:hypothetical protein
VTPNDAKRPKGEKRPADVIGNAVHVMRIATGETDERPSERKNAAAVELGRRCGLKGGKERASKMSAERPKEIARPAMCGPFIFGATRSWHLRSTQNRIVS